MLRKSRLSLIVRVNVVLYRTVIVDNDWRFDNLCGSHLQSLVIDLIGQLRRDVIGCLSVKPWCYWLWRLVISDWCFSIRLLSQWNRQKPKHATDQTQTRDEEWWRQQSHCWAPFKDETSNWLGLCDMYNVLYRLLSTSYFRKLVY